MTARTLWHIPELWPGSTVFIIGGGPSITNVDLSLLHSQRCIGVNQAYKFGPWVDVCYFGDCGWYGQNLPLIRSFGGLKLTSCTRCPSKGWKHVHRIRRSKMYGLETERRDSIAWNNCSGASAINIAFWLGAKRIVLLGFDMRLDRGKKNYHNDYQGSVNNPDIFKKHMRGFPQIARDALTVGIEILNATPNSAITNFPSVRLEEVV